ncbi:MAG TPA: PfkB family carbohydrate kinase [Candidatus Eisenbacteria bacterium]|nr:PfkB family carbohydrate kinase [Candidatus Eisenbacteria bacterium]
MSVLVVGSVALDSVRTPNGSVEEALGGSASYFSLAARHFTDVQMVAVVGDDFPSQSRELLVASGVDVGGLSTKPGRTFRWAGEYGADLAYAKTLATELNVFAAFHPELTPRQRQAETVFLANIDPELQLEVLDQVESPLFVACDTMNYWITSKRSALMKVMRRADVCLLNDEEARLLSGDAQVPRAARLLLDEGVKCLLVKKGEHGALLFSRDERFFCPAYPHEKLVDPTGAGDAFAGGFVGYLDQQGGKRPLPLRQAMICGTALASLCVEAFSPQRLAEITRGEIAERVKVIRSLAHMPDVTFD